MNITEIHNSAAIGWRWNNGHGATYEIVWIRGATRLRFGVKPEKTGEWVTVVMDETRWSCDGTEHGARACAHEFIATC
ncbi:hypothetical protein [Prauserella flavalba]|uniref:hypothetical protein n=1 Tax=Prauserella flavalba TaxID=1477506 RepID=UPI0036EBB69B